MKINNIGIITYNYPHLKTEQVFQRIVNKPYKYKVFALPFRSRKNRSVLFKHRPDQSQSVSPEVIAKKHKIPFFLCNSDEDIDSSCDIYLILGAGILSSNCVKNKKIINCHPGIIPASRGLDSFKWSILEKKPIGITLHYIDEKVDAGEIISVIPTNVYIEDTIETLARRHYENEIDCMSNFDYYLNNNKNEYKNIEIGEAKMRMPIEKEQQMLDSFNEYSNKYGKEKIKK
jgi:phosphoribosylglycinamide formyltransferase 1